MLKCLFCTMHNYNEQIIKNGSGRMKRPPLAKNSKAEEVQFLRSSIPLCFCVHIPAPILFWCRYPLVCGYFVALLSGIFIDIGPCNKHFSKSNHSATNMPSMKKVAHSHVPANIRAFFFLRHGTESYAVQARRRLADMSDYAAA